MYFPTFLARLLTWDIGISLSKHKRFEIQMSPDPFIGFEFAFIKTMHIHHPGFHLSIKFIFFIIDFDFYDRRHWDHALHEYETYDSEKPSRSARAEFVEKENGI
jgi:hypothetical protein